MTKLDLVGMDDDQTLVIDFIYKKERFLVKATLTTEDNFVFNYVMLDGKIDKSIRGHVYKLSPGKFFIEWKENGEDYYALIRPVKKK